MLRISRPLAAAPVFAAVLLAASAPAFAQAPVTPPPQAPVVKVKKWVSTLSAGVTVTRGNKDTATYNAGYDVKYDTKAGNVLKTDGLFIHGTNGGVVSTNRLTLNVRDEHQVNTHFFMYAQTQLLKDQFKQIDYLVAPTAGLGLKPLDSARTKLNVNAGVGNVWERNTGRGVRRSGAITIGEKLSHGLSPAVTLLQSFNALWKTENLHDSLVTGTLGLAANLNGRMQFKIEWIDTFKNLPPTGVRRNDLSIIVALVLKN